jgi:hypothetical protein
MDGVFYTLQEFLAYTKGVTYILVIVTLIVMVWFWCFLVERDED